MMEKKMGENPAPGFINHPVHRVDLSPAGKRFVGTVGGQIVVDSIRAQRMDETGYDPIIYVPREDVRMELVTASEHHTYCPFKGHASYWTISAGDQTAEDAAWSYDSTFDEMTAIKGWLAFYPDRLDSWVETELEA